MRKLCKLLYICLFISCMFLHSTFVLSAKNDFKTELKSFLGHKPSESEVYDYSLMITTLKTSKLNTNAIAGIIGNISCESGGEIFTIEGYYPSSKKTTDGVHYRNFKVGKSYDYGNEKPVTYKYKNGGEIGGEGHGIVGWSFERATNLSKFAKDNSDKFGNVTVKHWLISKKNPTWKQHTCHIPNMAGQVAFMAKELSSGYKSVKNKMNSASDAKECAKIFMQDYEKPATATSATRQNAAAKAVAMVESCIGIEGAADNTSKTGNNKTKDANAIVDYMALSGCWTEDQISAFVKLSEANIQRNYLDDTKRSNLDQNSAENVTNWERNVDNNKKEYGFIAVLRKLIIFSGFFFIVWAILIYIAYWFDRINSIYCIDLLGKFTFNKLHISDTENECTFGVEGAGKKTVNHKAILLISLMSILIGVLVISGLFYKVISNIVYTILSFIKGES